MTSTRSAAGGPDLTALSNTPRSKFDITSLSEEIACWCCSSTSHTICAAFQRAKEGTKVQERIRKEQKENLMHRPGTISLLDKNS
jgi:hypothetical protein